MMCHTGVLVLLACSMVQAHVEELKANHNGDEQDLVDDLSNRALGALICDDAKLDDTVLGKPGQLAVSPLTGGHLAARPGMSLTPPGPVQRPFSFPGRESMAANAAKKGSRNQITMESTESPYRYYTSKNRKNTPERLKLMKYDPVLKKHCVFIEIKSSGNR